MKTITLALLALVAVPAMARVERRTLSHYSARPTARMANGRRYTDSRTIFASRAYPLGTRLRITHNGRTVTGTVEDKPAVRYGHRVDVNERARRLLGFRGLATARVEVIR